MINVFAFDTHRSLETRSYNIIIKAFWNNLDEIECTNKYRYLLDAFRLVTRPEDADICLLPLIWNYYIDHSCIHLVRDAYEVTKKNNKPLVILSDGDFTAKIPFPNVIIIQSSVYKSRDDINGQRLLALPTFIGDYLQMYCKGVMRFQPKREKPHIGFCGHASGSLLDYSRRQLSIWVKHVQYKLGVIHWEPPLIEPTRLRNQILKKLSRSDLVNTNFIARDRYRAGYRVKKKDYFHPTRVEFVNNILDTDYTVCVRGMGNFSNRFYETLALGRIPIFYDTDCLLPYQELVDYRDYCVWISESERRFAVEKIRDFHDSLSPREFQDRQLACRELFLKYLHVNGYFHNFHKLLELSSTSST